MYREPHIINDSSFSHNDRLSGISTNPAPVSGNPLSPLRICSFQLYTFRIVPFQPRHHRHSECGRPFDAGTDYPIVHFSKWFDRILKNSRENLPVRQQLLHILIVCCIHVDCFAYPANVSLFRHALVFPVSALFPVIALHTEVC